MQNRRFLVLGQERMPNLASRALGLALKALPEHWERRHGYRPLMAETFTDIEPFEGTCYKASNWEPLGLTKGFQRHRIDYYQKHGRPKKLWIKTLNRNALRILTAMDVPASYKPGLNLNTPERDLALTKTQMLDLRTHFQEHFKDPRRSNRTYPASSLLVFITMALFAGARHAELDPTLRQPAHRTAAHMVGLPPEKRHEPTQSPQLACAAQLPDPD